MKLDEKIFYKALDYASNEYGYQERDRTLILSYLEEMGLKETTANNVGDKEGTFRCYYSNWIPVED